MLDSGIRSTHVDFQNKIIQRGKAFQTIIDNNRTLSYLESVYDDRVPGNGHGTFVASIVAGHGMSSSSNKIVIVPVVVVNSEGEGDSNTVLKATMFAIRHRNKNHRNMPSILLICLSERQQLPSAWMLSWLLHPIKPEPLDEAFRLAHVNGFATVVAAGNWSQDACYNRKSLPLPKSVIVVAASDKQKRAKYSNFGECVSLFAPGKTVAASAQSDISTAMFEGTSVSAALVARELIHFWNTTTTTTTNPVSTSAESVCSAFLERSTFIQQEYIQQMRCETDGNDVAICLNTTRRALVIP